MQGNPSSSTMVRPGKSEIATLHLMSQWEAMMEQRYVNWLAY